MSDLIPSPSPVAVVIWRWTDGSGAGVVAVFQTMELANACLFMLETHGAEMKEFSVSMCDVLCGRLG